MAGTSTETGTDTEAQVLEFELGPETYCVDIEYVAEIVEMGELTTIPNSPPHIRGVMDLRGRTTSIVDPKTVLDVPDEGESRRIIVFDPDRMETGEATGWTVDEVYQVVRVDEADLDESPAEDKESIRGVLKREDGFVVWLAPDVLGTA